jgi:ABC-2 type transport system ATP-binding protein
MSAPLLQIDQLAKTFRVGLRARKIDAVRDVSLQLQPGESVGYLGPNGSGKTTSIKCILGLIRPTRGTVQLFGRDPGDPVARARVGYLPESPYFYDYLTPREVLHYAGQLFGLDRVIVHKRGGDLLDRMGLHAAADRPLRGFSKGMLQRLGIAQSLLNDPDLLIYDEPLSGLDPLGRKEVRDLMADLRHQGKSLFFSSHVLTDIETLCDTVVILREGTVVAQGRLETLLEPSALEVEILLALAGARPVAVEAVLALAGVVAVERTEARLRLQLPKGALAAVLQQALAAGLAVEEVTPRRDSLEDLFLRKAVRATDRAA